MMSINVDWDKLRAIEKHLSEATPLMPETEIIFVMIMGDGTPKKSIIKFKDFLNFFWSISENTNYNVITLVVQDKEGRILYRHKQMTAGNEEIPAGGNAGVFYQWATLTPEEKTTYVRLMVAQINGYER